MQMTTTKHLLTFSTIFLLFLSYAQHSFSASMDDDPTPKPTETTKKCDTAEVWDKEKQACVAIKESHLSDDDIFTNARELAYADRYDDAIALLDTAADREDPRILNYLGFSYRKAGDMEKSMTYYLKAIENDPDYLLARSYMGQGLHLQGKKEQALAQLVEIRQRGSEQTWAYRSLEQVINGQSYTY